MKFLLATDGSRFSAYAAKFLACLDLSAEDEIIVFHAAYWLPFRYDSEYYLDTFKEIQKEITPRIIDSMMNLLKPVRAKVSSLVLDGPPEQRIIDAAVEHNADLIVMGARGLKGMKSFFLGSVTNSVAAHSPKPVFVTKMPSSCEPGGKMKILFAADGSACSLSALELLAEIPFPGNAELTLLNVCPEGFELPVDMLYGITRELLEIMEKQKALRLAESRRIVGEAGDFLGNRFKKFDSKIVTGHPPTEILALADSLKADMIVLGCRGVKGLERVLGSVSRNVLTHAKCSVLIGRPCK